MDDPQRDVGSTAATDTPVEGWMLREDIVREVLARLARGECVKAIARELGVDKKTIKRWRARGEWRPQTTAAQAKAIDAYRLFLARRGPEVGWNGMVLHRELRTQGFTGGYQQVQRALQPVRTTRRWGRCCMNTRCRWGGVARTSRDPPQEPHYGDEVEGSSHV